MRVGTASDVVLLLDTAPRSSWLQRTEIDIELAIAFQLNSFFKAAEELAQ